MATFVLVHGAWHGGWCWEDVTPRLEAAGHTAFAPDLPGLGSDRTPLAEITLEVHARRIAALTETFSEPVILVGHSLGGVVISQAAEYASRRIARLIYVAAFLLPDSESVVSVNSRSERPQIDGGLIETGDGGALVEPDIARRYFYQHSPLDRVEWAIQRLRPQPMGILAERVNVGDGFTSLPRAYVEAADDAILPLKQQRDMQVALPCHPVITLPSDHSPFLSMPDRLAAALIQIAGSHADGAPARGGA